MTLPRVYFFTKLICITSFLSIISALTLLILKPGTFGYEISLYEIYPWYLWVLLSLPLLMPFFVLIIDRKSNPNIITNLTIFCDLLCIFLIFSLPLIRGYVSYGAGDTLSHLGFIKDIIYTGRISPANPYPLIHIWIFALSSLINCSIETISLIALPVLLVFSVLAMYLLSRSLNYNNYICLYIVSFAAIPIVPFAIEYINPSQMSYLLFPLLLFIIFKFNSPKFNVGYSTLQAILSLYFAFAHPEIIVFSLCVLLILIIVCKLKWLSKSNRELELNLLYSRTTTSLLLLLVGCLAWFSTTFQFKDQIRGAYDAFVLNLVPIAPPLMQLTSGFRLPLIDALLKIINIYGPAIMNLTIAGVLSSLLIIKYFVKGKTTPIMNLLLMLSFFVFLCINTIFLLKGTSIGFHIFRQIKYPLMISTIILGSYFGNTFLHVRDYRYKPFVFFGIIIILLISISLTIQAVYPSPSTYAVNYQITSSDISGMRFLFNYWNETKMIREPGGRAYQRRFFDYLFGSKAKRPNNLLWYTSEQFPPDHFSYDHNLALGQSYMVDQYLLVYPPEEFYTKIYPNNSDLWKYTPIDYKELNLDLSVNRIYHNGGFKLFIITPRHN